ncbi:ATPase H(+)-transporting accessory protein 2 [Phlebotomus argentipes]|uniref:ATPase H(+)-transporting accessory protein 2 n=1 Tax=Phlebotomus argentipes TaxID=94469 RepID=UPI002892A1CF|nr:ATPase H(+)-transporting accessory protein 2 [Phlebotomus argentipes]
MLKFALISLFSIVAVNASGFLSVHHYPDSIEFKGNDELSTDLIPDVFLASLGYTIDGQGDFDGLRIRNPFSMPKSALIVQVDGIEKLNFVSSKVQQFPLFGASAANGLDLLNSRVSNHVNVDLEDHSESLSSIAEAYGSIKPVPGKTTSSLKPSVYSEDKDFLYNVAIINELTEKIKAKSSAVPHLVTVRISLSELASAHDGQSSAAFTDAKKLVTRAIEDLIEAAENCNDGNILVATITSKDDLSRAKRATPELRQEIPTDLNLAKSYSSNYPVIFNIILWFGVVLFFTLLAICYAIADMDPGRDSIIYRMTSTRMKKDN